MILQAYFSFPLLISLIPPISYSLLGNDHAKCLTKEICEHRRKLPNFPPSLNLFNLVSISALFYCSETCISFYDQFMILTLHLISFHCLKTFPHASISFFFFLYQNFIQLYSSYSHKKTKMIK